MYLTFFHPVEPVYFILFYFFKQHSKIPWNVALYQTNKQKKEIYQHVMYTMTDLYRWIGPLSTQRHQKEIRAKNKITRKLHLIASLDKLFQSLSSQKTSSAVMDNLPHISVYGYITLYVLKKNPKKTAVRYWKWLSKAAHVTILGHEHKELKSVNVCFRFVALKYKVFSPSSTAFRHSKFTQS